MNSLPNYDQSALSNLAERTEYETWFLEAVYAIAEQDLFWEWPDGMIYPLDQKEPVFCTSGLGNITIGDWRPAFLSAGAPLIFVSSFKLLDMLVDWIIERNGNRATFRFQQKINRLSQPIAFPPFVESHPWLKERLVGLYRTLEPLRGTIIHDRHFASIDGSIQVSSSNHGAVGVPIQISAYHLRKLVLTMVATLNYISGTWAFDEYREKTLRRDLDEIAFLHGLPLFGQRQPFFTRVRVYQTSADPLQVDPSLVMADLSRRYLDQDCMFDLRILVVRDGAVSDAYLLPWNIFAERGANWREGIDPADYRSAIPPDVDPEHLGRKAAAAPNGNPAQPLGNSDTGGGPPSVN
jgi:hypothetical protein